MQNPLTHDLYGVASQRERLVALGQDSGELRFRGGSDVGEEGGGGIGGGGRGGGGIIISSSKGAAVVPSE